MVEPVMFMAFVPTGAAARLLADDAERRGDVSRAEWLRGVARRYEEVALEKGIRGHESAGRPNPKAPRPQESS